MGIGGGLNNTVLLLTGDPLLAPLGPTLGYLTPPVVATAVGLAAVWRLHDDPRWSVVAAVAGVLLVGETVSVVL
jgi:hypothetical protein